ncbi:MAG: hypothetical protein HY711_04995 [Candidatus Melainabacteria bacterium]|nr:hypothetical protein [Candidatus Melainabacteria bacterium]
MASLGIIGEIYIVCTAAGSIYFLVGLVMGQLHAHDSGALGNQSSTQQDTVDTPHNIQAHHDSFDSPLHSSQHPATSAQLKAGSTGPVQFIDHHRLNVWKLVLTLLSPMALATFLAFFGITGLLLAKLLPVSVVLTLPVAIVAGLLITSQVLRLLRLMVTKLEVSSIVKVQELIGHTAEVLITIEDARTGEITYVAGSKRLHAPAKAAKPDANLRRGSKVMIVDVKDGIFYVEPWQDYFLESTTDTIFQEQEHSQEQ